MSAVVFVDTIYAHDRNADEKRDRAVQALERLWDDQTGRLSVQVLQEFYVTVTQKLATARAKCSRNRSHLYALGAAPDHA